MHLFFFIWLSAFFVDCQTKELIEGRIWYDAKCGCYSTHSTHTPMPSPCTSTVAIIKTVPSCVVELPPLTNVVQRTKYFILNTIFSTRIRTLQLPRRTDIIFIPALNTITITKPVHTAIETIWITKTTLVLAPTPTYVTQSTMYEMQWLTATITDYITGPNPTVTSFITETTTTDFCLTISTSMIPTDTITLEPSTVYETSTFYTTETTWGTSITENTLVPETSDLTITGTTFSTTLVPETVTVSQTNTVTDTAQVIAPTPTYGITETGVTTFVVSKTFFQTEVSTTAKTIVSTISTIIGTTITISCTGTGTTSCHTMVIRRAPFTAIGTRTQQRPLRIEPTQIAFEEAWIRPTTVAATIFNYISPSEKELLEGLF